MSLFSISPSPVLCFTRPCCSCTVTSRPPSRPHVLAALTCPKSAGHAHLRTSAMEFGHLAKSALNTGYEPKKFDKITSVDSDTMLIDDPDLNEVSDFTKTTHNTGLFGVLTMFESSVSHVSHDDIALQIESKESMHRETDCQTETERETETETERERFCDQYCVVDVKEKSTEQYFESFSSDSQRILFWWVRSPRKVQHGYPELETKRFRIRIIRITAWAWTSKMTIIGLLEANQYADKAQRERIHLCSELETKDHFYQESYARSCREI